LSTPDFSPRSDKLIVKTVRKVLGAPRDGSPDQRPLLPQRSLETALLKVTAVVHRGYYTVDVYQPKVGDVVTTSDIAWDQFGTARATGCILMNPTEIDAGTPFAVNAPVIGRYWYVNSDGKAVFLAAEERIPFPRPPWSSVSPINAHGDLACIYWTFHDPAP
jgi:hypothetical protein